MRVFVARVHLKQFQTVELPVDYALCGFTQPRAAPFVEMVVVAPDVEALLPHHFVVDTDKSDIPGPEAVADAFGIDAPFEYVTRGAVVGGSKSYAVLEVKFNEAEKPRPLTEVEQEALDMFNAEGSENMTKKQKAALTRANNKLGQ